MTLPINHNVIVLMPESIVTIEGNSAFDTTNLGSTKCHLHCSSIVLSPEKILLLMEQHGVMLSLEFLLVTLDATLKSIGLTILLLSLGKRFSVVLRTMREHGKKGVTFSNRVITLLIGKVN